MKSLPHYGPWDDEQYPRAELTEEEVKRHQAEQERMMKPDPDLMTKWMKVLDGPPSTAPLSNIPYSPPYPPIDPVYARLWSTLLSAGIMDVQMVKQDGKIGFTVHQTQTITLEKGKFYPIEPNGGQIQQDKFFQS